MFDIWRESTVGELLNRVSGGRILPYPDQRPDFVIPERYLATSSPASTSSSSPVTRTPSSATLCAKEDISSSDAVSAPTTTSEKKSDIITHPTSTGIDVEKFDTVRSEATLEAGPELRVNGGGEKVEPDTKGYQLVDWYGDDDPENPRNWSFKKRAFVLFEICLLT